MASLTPTALAVVVFPCAAVSDLATAHRLDPAVPARPVQARASKAQVILETEPGCASDQTTNVRGGCWCLVLHAVLGRFCDNTCLVGCPCSCHVAEPTPQGRPSPSPRRSRWQQYCGVERKQCGRLCCLFAGGSDIMCGSCETVVANEYVPVACPCKQYAPVPTKRRFSSTFNPFKLVVAVSPRHGSRRVTHRPVTEKATSYARQQYSRCYARPYKTGSITQNLTTVLSVSCPPPAAL